MSNPDGLVFFILSKILGLIFEPLSFLVLCLSVGGILLALGRQRLGRRVVIAATLIILVIGLSPLPALLLRVLEDRFPSPDDGMPGPAGIIVLGGSINSSISGARGQITLDGSASRLTTAVALALRYPKARLVFTGGTADLRGKEPAEAGAVHRLWTSLGVPDAQMTFENKARNTYENAAFTLKLVAPQPGQTWLLVTSAAHMPRAMGIFRQTGFPVVPYPVDYRTYGTPRDWHISLNILGNFNRFELASHEWVGLAAYWLSGKTDALFPAP